MDTVVSAIGDVAAGVAAVAAVIGLRYARQTVREARAERWALNGISYAGFVRLIASCVGLFTPPQ